MKNPRKVYRFSLTLSLLITIFVILINALLLFFYTDENPFSKTNIIPLGLSVIFIFSVCFIVFNFRIENYIYKQIKQFYKDLEPNFGGEMNDILITNDVDSLLNNVKQIALNRSVEIDSLKDQAAFRREFLGNIAHELKTPLFTVQGYILTLLDGAMNDKNVNRKNICCVLVKALSV